MIKLDRNKKYLLACSFGTDSMALFDMLHKGGYNFSIVHINYGLREEADNETETLIKYCKEKDVPFFIKRVGLFFPKGNIEAECRYIRYTFFKKIYDEGGYDALLVAHQQDDHIETYLLQIQRNNNPGYYGLPYERELFGMRVIRPLLEVTKSQINQYLSQNSIPHSIDKTNLEDKFQRNKIRHHIVEKMSKKDRANILKEIDEKNIELSKKLAKLRDLTLNSVKTLLSLTEEDFVFAFYILTEKIPNRIGISRRSILSFRKSLESNKPNITVTINKVIEITKTYDEIIVQMADLSFKDQSFEYVLKEPGILDTPYFYLNSLIDPHLRNIKPEDYPITIRNAKPSDEFIVKDYRVKMRRAVIDWKMPSYLRNRWPVVISKYGHIIYVPRFSKDFIITENLNFYVKF